MGRTSFNWTAKAIKAVSLLARAQLSQDEIANELDVDRKTIWSWRQHPDFRARVDEELDHIRAEVRRVGIASKNNRLAAYNQRHRLLNKLLSDRADDKRSADEPGGSTGLLQRDIKRVASDTDEGKPTTVELVVWKYEAAILAEMRALEKQAAVELGEWDATDDPAGLDLRTAVAKTEQLSKEYVDPDNVPIDRATNEEGEPSEASDDDEDA